MSRLTAFLNQLKPAAATSRLFSQMVGVDLGSLWCTLFWADGTFTSVKNCVAIHERSGAVVAVGEEAAELSSRPQPDLRIIWPVRRGRLSDMAAQATILQALLKDKAASNLEGIILVNSALTEVEYRALQSLKTPTIFNSLKYFDRSLFLANILQKWRQPLSPVMIIEAGQARTTVAIVGSDQILALAVADFGTTMIAKLVTKFFREQHQLLIGASEAAKVVDELLLGRDEAGVVRGQELASGLVASRKVSRKELGQVAAVFIDRLMALVNRVVETSDPQTLDQIWQQGIFVVGTPSRLPGLHQKLEELSGGGVHLVPDVREIFQEGFEYLKTNKSARKMIAKNTKY